MSLVNVLECHYFIKDISVSASLHFDFTPDLADLAQIPPPYCNFLSSLSLAERAQRAVPFADCVITCNLSKSDPNYRKTVNTTEGKYSM